MALNKEVWIEHIVGNLYGATSSISRSVNHSEYIDNKVVHVPNAGAPAKIGKNVKELPLTVSSREDIDLTYKINDYKIYPTLVTNLEQTELSYDKRESVLRENRAKLYEETALDIIASWVACVKKPIAKVSLSVKEMIKGAAKQFAVDKVPSEGRCVMLTPDNYYKLLDELTEQEQFAFSASADASRGVLGKYYGFEILDEYLLPKDVEMLAWSPLSVSRALGDVHIYANEQDATYYGDVLSGDLRAGGHAIRQDCKGIYVVDADGLKDDAPLETIEDMGEDD